MSASDAAIAGAEGAWHAIKTYDLVVDAARVEIPVTIAGLVAQRFRAFNDGPRVAAFEFIDAADGAATLYPPICVGAHLERALVGGFAAVAATPLVAGTPTRIVVEVFYMDPSRGAARG